MITRVHALFYSADPAATRRSTAPRQHPRHLLFCDAIESTEADLRARGVEFTARSRITGISPSWRIA
jgi:hypothetical protein